MRKGKEMLRGKRILSVVLFMFVSLIATVPAMGMTVIIYATEITVVDVGLNPDFQPRYEDGKLVDNGRPRYDKTSLDDQEISAAVNGGKASDYWGTAYEWRRYPNSRYKTTHNDSDGFSSWLLDPNF
jgi:hypothetical protein